MFHARRELRDHIMNAKLHTTCTRHGDCPTCELLTRKGEWVNMQERAEATGSKFCCGHVDCGKTFAHASSKSRHLNSNHPRCHSACQECRKRGYSDVAATDDGNQDEMLWCVHHPLIKWILTYEPQPPPKQPRLEELQQMVSDANHTSKFDWSIRPENVKQYVNCSLIHA